MAAGIGGYLGYLLVAALVWTKHLYSPPGLTPTVLVTLAVIALYFTTLLGVQTRRSSIKVSVSSIIMFLPILAYVVTVSLNHFFLPTSAWDALGHWTTTAGRFLDVQLAYSDNEFQYWKKHPVTGVVILSWEAWCAEVFTSDPWLHVTWPAFLASIAMITGGFVYSNSKNLALSIIAVYISLTIPLLENHTYLSGYMELPLATTVLGATTVLALGIQYRNNKLILAGVILSLAPVTIKNIGPMYTAAILSGTFAATVLQKKHGLLILALSTVTSFFVIWYATSAGLIDFEIFGRRIAYLNQKERLDFGGRKMAFDINSLRLAFPIEGVSKFLWMSFSTLPVALVLLAIGLATKHEMADNLGSFVNFALVALAIYAFLIASLTLDYGLQNAVIDRHTGHSRFNLPLFVIAPPLLFLYLGDSHLNSLTQSFRSKQG